MLNRRLVSSFGVLAGSCLTLGTWSATAAEVAPPAAAESRLAIEHAKINTSDPSPVDPGHVELEAGYSWTRARHAWDGDGDVHRCGLTREQAAGLALTVGLIPDVDVNLGLDYLWLRNDDNGTPTTGDNIGDLNLGGRYRFFTNEKYGIEAAWLSGFTAPTGSRERDDADELCTSQDFWSWDNALVLTKDWERWTMNAEVGWFLPFGDKRGDDRGTLIANFAAGYQLLDWLQPEVELNYGRCCEKGETDENVLTVTAGLVMPLNDCWRVNLGLQQAVWGEDTCRSTTAMLAVKAGF